jgi:hypothetical protein
MQPHHQIGAHQRGLLGGDVDIKIGIQVLERADFNIRHIVHRAQQRLAGTRMLRIGVGVKYENHGAEVTRLSRTIREMRVKRGLQIDNRSAQSVCNMPTGKQTGRTDLPVKE